MLLALCPLALAFVMPTAPLAPTRRSAAPEMNWFAGAFSNEDLGDREDAGLSKKKKQQTITWVGPNGQKKQSAIVPGQNLKDIARATGIKIQYDCNEGTCKTCEAMVDGRRTKICVAKAPAKDVTIKYNIR